MLTCELCDCMILHPERGDCASWYSICEHCLAELAQ